MNIVEHQLIFLVWSEVNRLHLTYKNPYTQQFSNWITKDLIFLTIFLSQFVNVNERQVSNQVVTIYIQLPR